MILSRCYYKSSLLHVVTRYFDTKFMEKSKQILQQPGPLYKCKFVFVTKRKKIG